MFLLSPLRGQNNPARPHIQWCWLSLWTQIQETSRSCSAQPIILFTLHAHLASTLTSQRHIAIAPQKSLQKGRLSFFWAKKTKRPERPRRTCFMSWRFFAWTTKWRSSAWSRGKPRGGAWRWCWTAAASEWRRTRGRGWKMPSLSRLNNCWVPWMVQRPLGVDYVIWWANSSKQMPRPRRLEKSSGRWGQQRPFRSWDKDTEQNLHETRL